MGGGEERRRPQEAVVRGPGGRRGGARMRRPVEREDSEEEAGQEEREELEEAGIKVPDGKIGKKKMEKLQAKADKKLQREAEQKEREENKKKREKMDEDEKLKAAFSVEEEGCDAGEEGDEENKLLKFINYIKETKVVLLEDLAAQFHLKTQEAIDRVVQLQSDGLLTGVIDDRGKFIYVSQEELEAVVKFIRQQGRVSITDLAMSSNQLIKL